LGGRPCSPSWEDGCSSRQPAVAPLHRARRARERAMGAQSDSARPRGRRSQKAAPLVPMRVFHGARREPAGVRGRNAELLRVCSYPTSEARHALLDVLHGINHGSAHALRMHRSLPPPPTSPCPSPHLASCWAVTPRNLTKCRVTNVRKKCFVGALKEENRLLNQIIQGGVDVCGISLACMLTAPAFLLSPPAPLGVDATPTNSDM